MLIVTEARLGEYTRRHPEAASALFRWAGITRGAVWGNLVKVRMVFRHADQVGACTVFNIMGNNYRLITRVDYGLQTVTLKHFLTHEQYDRDKWKKDC
jgi:mRNA interferase HigB